MVIKCILLYAKDGLVRRKRERGSRGLMGGVSAFLTYLFTDVMVEFKVRRKISRASWVILTFGEQYDI